MSEYFGVQIISDPWVFGGRPVISQHRVTVHDVVARVQMGESQDEVARGFALTPTEVRAALAYYQDHQQEIDEEIAEDEREISRRAQEDKSPATEILRKRLMERRRSNPDG